MKYYAGVGSRDTPDEIQRLMTKIATKLEHREYILRSGGAEGADTAFEQGIQNPSNKEIFQVFDYVPKLAFDIAKRIHPAWDKMGAYGKSAHARNICQIMGIKVDTPVEFVICWTPGAKKVGGTRTAILFAEEKGIPVYNLANTDQLKHVIFHIVN